MIVTLQTGETLAPKLSVRGGMIKIDLGALLIEMDIEEFKHTIADLTTQVAEHGIYDQSIR